MPLEDNDENIDFSKLKKVTSENFFLDKDNKLIDPKGLFSQQIFGPIRNYKCECGTYSFKSLHKDKRCPHCRVLCTNNDVRYTTFAKIVLDIPYINKIGFKNLSKIMSTKTNHVIDNIKRDLSLTTKNYLTYNKNGRVKLLNEKDISSSDEYINITVTGIYSLYLSILSLNYILSNDTSRNLLNCFNKELLVVPPKCRNTIKLDNSKLIKSDIDEWYQNVIRIKKYERSSDEFLTEKLKGLEEHAKKIAFNSNYFIDTDYDIKNFDHIASKSQYYINKIYKQVSENLSGKEGYIRKNFMGKTIDFSSRAVIIPNTKLKTYEIIIPKQTFLKLYFLHYLYYLREVKGVNTYKIKNVVKGSMNSDVTLDHFNDFIKHFFKSGEIPRKDKLLLINRQPTLWRWGIVATEVVGVNNNKCLEISPNIMEPFAADSDGDTMAMYKLHDSEAMQNLEDNAFIGKFTKYDHNENYLHKANNELKYCFKLLLNNIVDDSLDKIIIDKVQDLPENFELYNELYRLVYIKKEDIEVTYGVALLNKWVKNKRIKITKDDFKNESIINQNIEHNTENNSLKYHDLYNDVIQKMLWILNSNRKEAITMPFEESLMILEKNKENLKLMNKLPQNAYIGNYVYNYLIDKNINAIPKEYKLYKVTESRFKKAQFARSIIGIGYIADNKNMVDNKPIEKNLFQGLTEDEFFRTSYGSRKGLVDKEKAVPKSGSLERSMVYNLSPVELNEDDCGTPHGFDIKIKNYKHGLNLLKRYCLINNEWVLFTKDMIEDYIGETLKFRSPITCYSPNFKICKKCFGEYKSNSSYIGVITGQSTSERLTQLSMSSFHTSGSASLKMEPELQEFIKNNIEDIRNYEDESQILFNKKIPDNIKSIFMDMEGYKYIINNSVFFENIEEKITNQDVSEVIGAVNGSLLTETGNSILSIEKNYQKFVDHILSKQDIYSVFFEIILCNLYVNDDNKIYRYMLRDGDKIKISKKYNIDSVHSIMTNGILSLVFRPNSQNIINFYKNKNSYDNSNLSIFEKIWLELL